MRMYTFDSGAASPGRHQCSICLADYVGFGHNAWPFLGRCCDDCNGRYVDPVRLARFRKWAARSERRHPAE
jgi:hypothetical protein